VENPPGPEHIASMQLRIKLRHRNLPPKPWKWEIHGDRLITASHDSFASQFEAHRDGRRVLKRLNAERAEQLQKS
jgi:hypothetical protein